MDELGSEFERHGEMRLNPGEYAAANPVPRLQHADRLPGERKFGSSSQTCGTCAYYQGIEVRRL